MSDRTAGSTSASSAPSPEIPRSDERKCPNVVGPVWKLDGESWACVLDAGHDGDHQGGDGTWWV